MSRSNSFLLNNSGVLMARAIWTVMGNSFISFMSYNILELGSCQPCLDPFTLLGGPTRLGAWELVALFFFLFFSTWGCALIGIVGQKKFLWPLTGARLAGPAARSAFICANVLWIIFFFIRCFECIKDVIFFNAIPDPDDWTLVQPIMKLFWHWASFSQVAPCIV